MDYDDTMTRHTEDPSGEMGTRPTRTAPGRAPAESPYYEVYEAYERAAAEALAKEEIPAEYRRHVREYFDALAEGEEPGEDD